MKNLVHRPLLIGAALVMFACSSTPRAVEPDEPTEAISGEAASQANKSARPDRMLRLVLKLTQSGLEEVSRTEAPNSMNRRDRHRRSTTFFRVYDRSGAILLERGFLLERHTRGEFPGPDGKIEGVKIPVEEPVFSVAVPIYPGWSKVLFFESADATRNDPTLLGEVLP